MAAWHRGRCHPENTGHGIGATSPVAAALRREMGVHSLILTVVTLCLVRFLTNRFKFVFKGVLSFRCQTFYEFYLVGNAHLFKCRFHFD